MDDQQPEVAVLVLVAEDQPAVRSVVEDALTEAGFAVIAASSGDEAMQMFDAHSAKVQAIVVDIRMGPGPNGWAVARHAREANPLVVVVYMSGDSAVDWNSEGVPNSVVLQKPFSPAQVVTALATLLNQVPPSAPTKPAA
jgi:DNA-binding response OmpR family regulator